MCCVCVCVCVCVLVFCGLRGQNLFNNMGMTEVLQFEGGYEDTAYVPVIQRLKKHTKWCFFENLKMHTISCEG